MIDSSNRTGSARVFIVRIYCFVFVGKLISIGPLDWSNHWYRGAYGHAVHSDSRARID